MTTALSFNVNVGQDQASSSVSGTGSMNYVITNTETQAFGLENLTTLVGNYIGQTPNNAYLSSPTPWGDLYTTYDWQQVTVNVEVQNVQISSMTSNPTTLNSTKLQNTSSESATLHTTLEGTVTSTTSDAWSTTSLPIGLNDTTDDAFSYAVSFLGVGQSEALSLTFSAGDTTPQSLTYTVGSSSDVTVNDVPAGETVSVALMVNQGTMVVEVTYEVTLSGIVACNYDPTFDGHHFWAYDVNEVLSANNLTQQLTFTQYLTIDFNTNANFVVTNPSGQVVARQLV